jgi:hypothetical protein
MSPEGQTGAYDPASGPLQQRIPNGHPFYWFERDVFSRLGNVLHGMEHAKIRLAGMKVQADNRDRVYHALTHLDVLWTWYPKMREDKEFMSKTNLNDELMDKIKIQYEKFKKKWDIGDDNMNPLYKIEGEEDNEDIYPKFKNKRPLTEEINKIIEEYVPQANDGI